jgi:phosphate transport system substrate-binding protein
MKTKKITALILAVMIIMAVIPAAVSAAPASTTLIIDGVTFKPKVEPIIEKGTMLVTLDVLYDAFGADTSYDSAKKQATIKTAAYTVVFTADSTACTVNGANRTLPATPKVVDNNIMVPVSYFAKAINATAAYNASTNTTAITYFTKLTGTLKIDGSTTVQPIAQAAADKLVKSNSGLSVTVAGGGSGTGIKDADAGTVNIGMSSRDLTADELKTLKPYAIANDGIAIIVNPDNPVKNLTKEQAGKIFLGEIKNWKEVGGNDAPIMVYTRETGSGTRSTFEELLLDKQSVAERAAPFTSSALIKQAVAKEKNAIGYDSIGFVDSTVKAVSLDGKTAEAKTVLDNSYGMGRQLFLCTKGDAKGLSAIFIDYLRTAENQKEIVEKEGYIAFK